MTNWFTNTIGTAAGDIYYYFAGGSAMQATLDAQTAQLNALNQQDYAPGGQVYNAIAAVNGTDAADIAYQQVQQNAANVVAEGSVQTQLQQAGQAGAAQGLSSLASGIQSFVSGLFSTLGKLMPWQAWVAIGVVAFWYIGGFKWLKGSAAK